MVSDKDEARNALENRRWRFSFLGRKKGILAEEREEKIKDPFARPRFFGRLRFWLDDSPTAMSISILLPVLAALVLLVVAGLGLGGDGKAPAIPNVSVAQVLALGESAQQIQGLDTPGENTTTIRQQAQLTESGRTVAPQVAQPIGTAPQNAPAAQDEQKKREIEAAGGTVGKLSIPAAAGSARGLLPLTGLFETKAKSVVYVIDKSSSMSQDRRLERVKAELIAGIQALEEHQRFSVVFFDDTTWPLFSQHGSAGTASTQSVPLMAADDANKTRAIDWVGRMGSFGGTNPYPGVMLALDAEPEQIILLSDGEFNSQFVRLITDANRGKSNIDCVGLGENIITLQQIARENNGVYYAAQ